MPEAMYLLSYLKLHVPPCAGGHVSPHVSKVACPSMHPGLYVLLCVQSYLYHMSSHVSEPAHPLWAWGNVSIVSGKHALGASCCTSCQAEGQDPALDFQKGQLQRLT